MAGVIVAGIASVSGAHTGEVPVIGGEPVVGETLTSSAVGDSPHFYKWQRCDPAVSDCVPSEKSVGGDWTSIPLAEGWEFRAYTLTESDLGHYIRVLAKDSDFSARRSDPVGPVVEALEPPPAPGAAPAAQAQPPQGPPTPQHGVRLVAAPVSGIPRVKLPGETFFRPLTEVTTIPVGSIVDTRTGRAELTAATGSLGSETPDESVQFHDGMFRILQPATANAHATAKLNERLSCAGGGADSAGAHAASRPVAYAAAKRRRKLWGSGSGTYSTAGVGGTGSLRGTEWLTLDTCRGTRFYVKSGIGITVFDKAKKKSVELSPGDSYFAKRG